MWGHMSDYGWSPGMGLGMLLFWGLLIVVVVMLARSFWSTGSSSPAHEKSALDLLKERYARGEIERDEFEQKRRDLEG